MRTAHLATGVGAASRLRKGSGGQVLPRAARLAFVAPILLFALCSLFSPRSAWAIGCPDKGEIHFPGEGQTRYYAAGTAPDLTGLLANYFFVDQERTPDNTCTVIYSTSGTTPVPIPAGYPAPGFYELQASITLNYTATLPNGDVVNRSVTLTSKKGYIGIIGVDLDVDSNNNNGVGAPDRSQTEDDMEEAPPGKIVFVNHNDDDNDGIPDYADPQIPGEGNLVPLKVSIAGFQFMSKIRVSYSYDGPPSVDLPAFTGQPIGNNMTNYVAAKQGTMRLWCRDDPGIERRPVFYVIPNHTYTLDELNYSGGDKTHLIEGVNAGEDRMIALTVTYEGNTFTDRVMVSVVEPTLGVNCSNGDPAHLRPGVPDVDFEIDENDEIVKHQGNGFQWWWARQNTANLDDDVLVDLAPLVVSVSHEVLSAGFRFFLEARGPSSGSFVVPRLFVYPAVSPGAHRREFLETAGAGSNQLAEAANAIELPLNFPPKEVSNLQSGLNEFVFKAGGSTAPTVITLTLLAQEPMTSNRLPVDSVRLTFRQTQDYWLLASTRGNNVPNTPYWYATENGRQVQISRYPAPHEYAAGISGFRDPQKTNCLVVVHGYNVSPTAAIGTFDEIYRRLFWLGFRGNFVGLSWHGNEAVFPGIFLDTQVRNGFQTSPALEIFLNDTVHGAWGVPADNIDLMAHSLGNLVLFDALRLHRRRSGSGELVRNAIGYESATWPEAYRAYGPVYYDPVTDDPIAGNPAGSEFQYSVDQLQQHSWAFWFNQVETGLDYSVRGPMSGEIYHSYLPSDAVLDKMRLNDYKERGAPGPPLPFIKWWHYHRNKLERTPSPEYRAPEGVNNFHSIIPTLMRYGQRDDPYNTDNLNLPVGTEGNPMAAVNYLAELGGWRHAATTLDLASHSRYIGLPLPQIFDWYDEFLGDASGTQPGRIPIGEE